MLKAFVTGGTRGIGWAIADLLARSGMKVTVSGTKAKGKAPASCQYVSADLSNTFDVARVGDLLRSERWDILINNAGINKIGRVESYDTADFQNIQNVNLLAPFELCKAVVPGMRKRKFGRILNITSIFGMVSRAERSAYSASKFGLFGLTRALALEVARDNVLVNCLAPGFVETDMTKMILKDAGIKKIRKQIPMERLARPVEIAKAARFLVSEDNTYITGQTVTADGGFTSV